MSISFFVPGGATLDGYTLVVSNLVKTSLSLNFLRLSPIIF